MVPRLRARSRGLVLGALALLSPLGAAANGRFPFSQQLLRAPDDPARLWLRASYGFVTSGDDGATWGWVCERAIGYSGTEDPAIAVSTGGVVLGGVFDGLSRSDDQGCSWRFAPPALAGRFVVDLSTDRADPTRVWALASNGVGGGRFLSEVLLSTDRGLTFEARPALVDDVVVLTLDAAPSRPERVYVSASGVVGDAGTPGVTMLVSDDGGATFARHDLGPLAGSAYAYIAAVHPTDPDRLWVRTNGEQPGDGGDPLEDDALLVSADGGRSFTEVARRAAHLGGVALSPDGGELLAGWGDARVQGLDWDEAAVGLFRASTADHAFRPVLAGRVSCATWTPDALYVCGSQFDQGFELGRSTDDGASWEPLLRLDTLPGPLAGCSSQSSIELLCRADWPAQCECLRGPMAPGCDPDGGAEGGTDGGVRPAAEAEADCACRAPGKGSRGGAVVMLLGAALALGVRARRARAVRGAVLRRR